MENINPTPSPSPKERGAIPTQIENSTTQIAHSAIFPKERLEIVFFISDKKENITKLTKLSKTHKEGFRFAIKFCEEFGFGMPIAFYLTPIPSPEERGAGVVEGRLYYYEDTEINSYLDNQMSLEELKENNWCDALVRNTEDLHLMNRGIDADIDAGSLFLVRGDYAYYISDYSILIPLVDLEHVVINLS